MTEEIEETSDLFTPSFCAKGAKSACSRLNPHGEMMDSATSPDGYAQNDEKTGRDCDDSILFFMQATNRKAFAQHIPPDATK